MAAKIRAKAWSRISNPIIPRKSDMAKAGGCSVVTLNDNIKRIEKAMGFEEGDLNWLVNMTVDPRQETKPCLKCERRTKRKSQICLNCDK
jgi:hypothetical protein